MNFVRSCLFAVVFSALIWAILIGLVVVAFGQEANPKLLPPEGLVIVVPRILFPPEKEIELHNERTTLDYFLVATQLDRKYWLTAVELETKTKPKSTPSRQFWIAKEAFGGDVDVGNAFALFNTRFRVEIVKTLIPFVFRNQIDQIVGFPLKLKFSFDGQQKDFYPHGDTFQLVSLVADIIDNAGKKYEVRTSGFFESALYRITNGTYAGAAVDVSPAKLTICWGKIKEGLK